MKESEHCDMFDGKGSLIEKVNYSPVVQVNLISPSVSLEGALRFILQSLNSGPVLTDVYCLKGNFDRGQFLN